MDASPSPRYPRPARPEWRAWQAAALPLLIFFALPVLALLLRSDLLSLPAALGMPAVQQAILVSLRTTLVSLGLALALGTPLAYWLGRQDFRGKRLLEALIDLPTVLPPSVAGLALLLAFGRRSLLGGWLASSNIALAFTPAAVVLAQLFVAAPFFVRAAALGFAAIDPDVDQAAQLDGASRWQVFRYIHAPLARPSLVSGALLCWARALGEFGATILFAGNLPGATQTMPTAIYLGFEADLQMALILAVILLVISAGLLLTVRLLAGGE